MRGRKKKKSIEVKKRKLQGIERKGAGSSLIKDGGDRKRHRRPTGIEKAWRG